MNCHGGAGFIYSRRPTMLILYKFYGGYVLLVEHYHVFVFAEGTS